MFFTKGVNIVSAEKALKFLRKQVLPYATLLSILSATVTYIGQDISQRQLRKADRVLEFYSAQFSTDKSEIGKHIQELNYKYSSATEQLKAFLASGSEKEINKKYYYFIMNYFVSPTEELEAENFKKIMAVKDFYESIANCVETGLCDESNARALFGREGRNFFALFHPFFCDLRTRTNDDSIAQKLEEFYAPPKDNKSRTCQYLDTTEVALKPSK